MDKAYAQGTTGTEDLLVISKKNKDNDEVERSEVRRNSFGSSGF